jgi:lipoyl(octanoyl) transferase
MASSPLLVRQLGCQPYEQVWQAMSRFTNERNDDSTDELWVVEHEPVYTQGQTGKPEHVLQSTDIPIVQTDRGGQVTYHGPGQIVLYPLINLRRYHLGVRDLVSLLESLVVEWLASYDVAAYPKPDAPGVYVKKDQNDVKIASLGLRIRRGCSFHGVSINVDMDLSPFQWINPCGYQGLQMTQLTQEIEQPPPSSEQCQQELIQLFSRKLELTVVATETCLPQE